MLTDYIAANRLRARVIDSAAMGELIKCDIFSRSDSFFMTVRFAHDNINSEKLAASMGPEIQKINGSRIETITGYKEKFLPPISVFGLKVLVDSKIMKKPIVSCVVGEDKILEISPNEILEANKEAVIKELT